MGNDGFTMILALIDFKNQIVKWSVNCEFELKGSLNIKNNNHEDADGIILNVQIDNETNNLLVLMKSEKILKITFPFKNHFLLKLSKLSKQLQTLLRCVDEVKGQFQKLTKLQESIFKKVNEIDAKTLQKSILFGCNKEISSLKDSDILDWKSKLKKLHAELLVSIQELSRTSIDNDKEFCSEIIDKFMNSTLKEMENQSRSLQHDLAEFIVWLEIVVIDKIMMKPFSSGDERNLKLLKRIQSSDSNDKDSNYLDSVNPLVIFKKSLEDEFKMFISEINSTDLEKIDEISKPFGFDRIVSVNPLILLLNNNDNSEIHLISSDFKEAKTVKLPAEFLSHYSTRNQIVLNCKEFIKVTINKDMTVINELVDELDTEMLMVFNHPSSNRIYTTSPLDPRKLTIH